MRTGHAAVLIATGLLIRVNCATLHPMNTLPREVSPLGTPSASTVHTNPRQDEPNNAHVESRNSDATSVTTCPVYDESQLWSPERWSRSIPADTLGSTDLEQVYREVQDLGVGLPNHAQMWIRAVRAHVADTVFRCELETHSEERNVWLSLVVQQTGLTLFASVSTNPTHEFSTRSENQLGVSPTRFSRCIIERLRDARVCPHRSRDPLLLNIPLARSSNPWR